MATIRSGNSAVLVIDTQVGVVATAFRRDTVVQNIRSVVDQARRASVPVLWIQHASDELKPGSPGWQIVPELSPAPNEARIGKQYNSSFEATDLETRLSTQGTSHLVLCGAATNWCVRATAYAALERGYDVTLVSDGHTTESIDLDEGRRVEAADIIADLNIALAWLEYPGRKNQAVTAAELKL